METLDLPLPDAKIKALRQRKKIYKASDFGGLYLNVTPPKAPSFGGLLDNAMEVIEKANPTTLKSVLPKEYGSPSLDKSMIGDLVMLFSDIGMHDGKDKPRDLLGRAY